MQPPPPPSPSQPKTKLPLWLKILGYLCFLGAFFAIILHLFSNLDKAVEGQLSVLRQKKITEAYYAYTSQEFQSTTSLEDFKAFIRGNPIFLNNTSAILSDKSVEGDSATVIATLYIELEKEAEVGYNLVKEDNSWKIQGIHIKIDGPVGNTPESSSATSVLIAPVEEQLKALQNNDILGAYKDLVSKQFQIHIPFNKFKIYVLQNSILTQFKHFDFKEHSIEGNHGIVTVLLNPESEAIPVKYKLIEENNEWKIDLMKISMPTQDQDAKAKNSSDTAQIISVVEELLSTFKQKEYDKAYQEFIAENIKKDTPLDVFKKFVKGYPAFTNYQSFNIKEPLIEDGIGHLVVDLHNNEGITSVEYTLKLLDNHWKIEGMHIAKMPDAAEQTSKEADGKKFKTRELLSVIQSFLKSIRLKEDEKAYQQYTSTNFKQTNSFQDFQKYLKDHPELTTTLSSSFEKLMFNNNIATFGGKLFISDKFYLPLEFDLIQEDDKWKILNIFIYPEAEISHEHDAQQKGEAAAVPVEFQKIILGSTVDEEGNIENPTTAFHENSGDINMNLFVRHGVAGTKIEIVLRHIESGSEIPPVSAILNDNGESELSFVFSPPPHGWPKGSYQIRVSSSTKVFKTFPFTVD